MPRPVELLPVVIAGHKDIGRAHAPDAQYLSEPWMLRSLRSRTVLVHPSVFMQSDTFDEWDKELKYLEEVVPSVSVIYLPED